MQKQPPEVFYKKIVLKKFTIFKKKYLCWSLFSNNVAGLKPATLLKKKFQHRYFPVNIFKKTYFEENLRTAASAGVLLEFCNDTFPNLQFIFFICNFATTQSWLRKYELCIEFLCVNFQKYRCPWFNCEVKFLSTSSHQTNLQTTRKNS